MICREGVEDAGGSEFVGVAGVGAEFAGGCGAGAELEGAGLGVVEVELFEGVGFEVGLVGVGVAAGLIGVLVDGFEFGVGLGVEPEAGFDELPAVELGAVEPVFVGVDDAGLLEPVEAPGLVEVEFELVGVVLLVGVEEPVFVGVDAEFELFGDVLPAVEVELSGGFAEPLELFEFGADVAVVGVVLLLEVFGVVDVPEPALPVFSGAFIPALGLT